MAPAEIGSKQKPQQGWYHSVSCLELEWKMEPVLVTVEMELVQEVHEGQHDHHYAVEKR